MAVVLDLPGIGGLGALLEVPVVAVRILLLVRVVRWLITTDPALTGLGVRRGWRRVRRYLRQYLRQYPQVLAPKNPTVIAFTMIWEVAVLRQALLLGGEREPALRAALSSPDPAG